jgi:hypothetical protein
MRIYVLMPVMWGKTPVHMLADDDAMPKRQSSPYIQVMQIGKKRKEMLMKGNMRLANHHGQR